MTGSAVAELEHVNVTVADADATARMLCELFGWQVRWKGAAKDNGYSVHVGSPGSYLAVYQPAGRPGTAGESPVSSYATRAGLNHIGVTVADIDATEAKVKAMGYRPHSHADYEPGRRFYFDEENGIEIEVVQY